MKESTYPKSTAPSIFLSEKRTLMLISYNGYVIQVVLRKPCNTKPENLISDITEYPKTTTKRVLLIRNPSRNNHIVGGFEPQTKTIYIHHRKRRYAISIPSDARLLYCGGGSISI